MNSQEIETALGHLRDIKSALTTLRSRLSSLSDMDVDWDDEFVTDFNPEQCMEVVENIGSDADDVIQQMEDMTDDDDMEDDDWDIDDEEQEDEDE